MARRSKVEQLPQPITDAVNGLIREGRTIDDILAHLRTMGVEDISRSAVGRHVKSARETFEKYRQAQEIAKVWVNKLEAEPNGDVSRLLPEMLRVVAFQTIGQMGETEEGANPMEVMLLAKALQHMSAAGKDHMAMELKMRDERKKLLAEQSAKLDAMGNKGGVTEETKRQSVRRWGLCDALESPKHPYHPSCLGVCPVHSDADVRRQSFTPPGRWLPLVE